MSQKSEISISKKNKILLILSIAIISVLMKLYLVDFSIPESGDSWIYVLRGIAHSEGDFTQTPFKTSGWPLLLSPFFYLVDSNEYLDYFNIARIGSILVSTITIIPIYFLGKKFFNEKYSIILVALFAFQPQINYNSILGYSESLLIFILITSMYFFFRNNVDKYTYLSFALIGLLWWAKMQGIVFLIVFSICYFIQYKNSQNKIRNFVICIFISMIIISPILFERYSEYDNPVFYGGIYGNIDEKDNISSSKNIDLSYTIFEPLTVFGVLLAPYLIFLFPLGIFYTLQKTTNKKYYSSLWFLLLSTMIPFLVLYAQGLSAGRHMQHILPFIMIISTFGIYNLIEKSNIKLFKINSKKILVTVVFSIFLLSLIVTIGIGDYGYGQPETKKIHEIMEYSEFLIYNLDGNMFWSKGVDSDWVNVTILTETETNLKTHMINPRFQHEFSALDKFNPGTFSILRESDLRGDSLEEIIVKGENLDLKFISVGKTNEQNFFNDVYLNPNNYGYLKKIFDSDEENFEYYDVKAFQIDYSAFHKQTLP